MINGNNNFCLFLHFALHFISIRLLVYFHSFFSGKYWNANDSNLMHQKCTRRLNGLAKTLPHSLCTNKLFIFFCSGDTVAKITCILCIYFFVWVQVPWKLSAIKNDVFPVYYLLILIYLMRWKMSVELFMSSK